MLWLCRACTAAYSVGAHECPQCGADDHVDEGGEQSLAGTSTSTSSERPPTSNDSSKSGGPRRARTTESP